MSKNTTPIVQFGVPVASVPDLDKKPPRKTVAPWWLAVADECKKHQGEFVPVRISGISNERLRSVPSEIKSGKLAAFREGNWEACYRDGSLYISYQGEPQPVNLRVAV